LLRTLKRTNTSLDEVVDLTPLASAQDFAQRGMLEYPVFVSLFESRLERLPAAGRES